MICISVDGGDVFGLSISYYPASDISKCTKVYNWDTLLVYWSANPSEKVHEYADDNSVVENDNSVVENDTESETEDGTEDVPEIEGVVIDYRGGFNDDVTGNWRLSTVVTSKSIKDYAFDYYKAYFNNDNEIHWIINYADNTTSRINCMDGYLFVSTYSHVDGEENSAKEIGGGSFISDCTLSAKDGKPADF